MKKKSWGLLAALCCLWVVMAFSVNTWAMTADSDVIYDGIDVSKWQGEIDFAQVRSSGIEVVYIRSSVGSDYIDPYFERNYENAKANGLKVGFYHYVTARNTAEAQQEARFFASVIGGKTADCKPVMDFEYFPGLTSAETTNIGAQFLASLEEYSGKEPAIYSDAYNARNIFGSRLGVYPLWIAEYGVNIPSNSPIWSNWSGWQYSDSGRIRGISGNVDLDYFTEGMFLSDERASTPFKNPGKNIYYTVQRGDTPWSLAQKYGSSVSELVELNDISNPNLIYVGETLKIPHGVYNNDTYRVVRGDTLWGIAQRLHTTVQWLAGINDISNPNLIYPGEIIEY